MRDLSNTFVAIDAANAQDPTRLGDAPLAFVQGRLASGWLERLDQAPTAELALTVRAHHLCRWEIRRSDFDAGRSGYLRWRRTNKRHQADSLAAIMADNDWESASIGRARELLARTALGSDRETQTLEDAACLVFLETQFDDIVDRLDHEHVVSIVAKTLKKMTPAAIDLAATIDLDPQNQAVLAEAVASLATT